MAGVWHVRLKAADGSLVAIIDTPLSFAVEKRVNAPGAYTLYLNAEDPAVSLFELDGQIEFWRRDVSAGVGWTLEFEAFHRGYEHRVLADDQWVYMSYGRGYLDLLGRRIIAAAAGSSGAEKSGAAETVVKAFVDEQAGPSAGSRAFSGLSVEADGGTGNTIRLARAYRNLLDVCQEIAVLGGGDFDVVGNGAAQFQFRWHSGQLGTDRSSTVVFALERGNMAQPRLTVSRAGEVSAVLVGGQGQGSDRTTVWRTDATRIGDSTWNRCERYADARNESEAAGLHDKGDALLAGGEPKRELSFSVLQTPGCQYRADYGLGDLVTARFAGVSETRKVTVVRFRVNQDGEQIDVETEAT